MSVLHTRDRVNCVGTVCVGGLLVRGRGGRCLVRVGGRLLFA